jgi:release factor glutamine methyltransferase
MTESSPAFLPPADVAAVVDRLRAAGCVFAEDEAALLVAEAGSAAALEQMVLRRVAGLPLEQILGWAEFCGRRVVVEPGVFVPRRRTELLVRAAAAAVRSSRHGAAQPADPPVVVDLCCGTGAIGLALSDVLGDIELHALDVDPAAVRCARRNVEPVGGRVYTGDLTAPLPRSLRGRVDVIVACPPYVPTDAIASMPPEARDHEPRVALDGGPDGLDLVRRIAAVASQWLAPGGSVVVEAGEPQVAAVASAFGAHGLEARVERDEEIGATVVAGASSRGLDL